MNLNMIILTKKTPITNQYDLKHGGKIVSLITKV